MRKSLLTVAALLTINGLTIAQPAPNDFRGFSWGSLLSQVKSNEKSAFVRQEKDDVLTYDDQLAGSDVFVNYQFNDNNKLVSGTYTFTKKYSNPQLYIQDYAKFRDLLTTKYGNPILNREEWRGNITPYEKENYGQAISDGELTLYSVWRTPRSEIKISLFTRNNVPFLEIYYTAKSLDELENKEELQKALPKL
jgi:hypothetical protein